MFRHFNAFILRFAMPFVLVAGLSGCLISKYPISTDIGIAKPFDGPVTFRLDEWNTADAVYKEGGEVTFTPSSGTLEGWSYTYSAKHKSDSYAINFIEIGSGRYVIEAFSAEEKKYYYLSLDLSDRKAAPLNLFGFTEATNGTAPACLVSAEECEASDFAELLEGIEAADKHGVRAEYILRDAALIQADEEAKRKLNVASAPPYRNIFTWKQASGDLAFRFVGQSPIDGKYEISNTTSVFAAPLPWRPDGRIVYLWDQSWNQPGLVLYFLIDADDRIYRLNGRSDDIHLFNGRYPPQFSSAQVAEEYLRFFVLYVRGEDRNKPFIVLNTVNNPFIPTDLKSSEFKRLDQIIKPAACESASAGTFDCKATVMYGNEVYRSELKVAPDGMVQMIDDVPILRNLTESATMQLE